MASGVIFNRERLLEGHRRWLERYNPLRGLDMTRLGCLFDAGTEGDFVELQWLNQKVERRDATVLALKKRRKAAQRKLDWTIKTVPEDDLPQGMTKKDAEKQRQHLEQCYNRIKNLYAAIEWLMLSDFRGYAQLEKIKNKQGQLTELSRVPQYHFTRDGIYGEWRFHLVPQMGNPLGGEVIEPEHWIVRESEDPSYELFDTCFVRKNLGMKDWDGFLETYGIPWFFLVMPPGVDGTDKEDAYYKVAQDVASDGRGLLPNGTEVKTADAGLRGQNPFSDYLRSQDEQQVLVGTGGILTMLTAAGSGTLAGSAHAEAWREIVGGEAAAVAEIFREEVDLPCLEEANGKGVERLAYFDLSEPQEKDPDAFVKRAVQLSVAGYRVKRDAVEEGAGVQLEEEGEVPKSDDDDLHHARGDGNDGDGNDGDGDDDGGEKSPERKESLKNRRVNGGGDDALLLSEATLARQLGAHRSFVKPVRAQWLRTIARVQARGEDVPVTFDEAEALLGEILRELGDLILPGLEGEVQAIDGMVAALEAGLGSSTVLGLRDALRERRSLAVGKKEL